MNNWEGSFRALEAADEIDRLKALNSRIVRKNTELVLENERLQAEINRLERSLKGAGDE
jgi:regulator of replication initiation timing